MESIYIQNLMKDQGSLELAMEILKKARKKIDDFQGRSQDLEEGEAE